MRERLIFAGQVAIVTICIVALAVHVIRTVNEIAWWL